MGNDFIHRKSERAKKGARKKGGRKPEGSTFYSATKGEGIAKERKKAPCFYIRTFKSGRPQMTSLNWSRGKKKGEKNLSVINMKKRAVSRE